MRRSGGLVAALLLLPPAAAAQIQDNSFLVEEAYNQEAGVVQHISTLELPEEGSEWSFSFTQEWPWRRQQHQLSYTVPVEHVDGNGGTGLGDVALHYRYQALGVGGGAVALAPRLSLLLPTGDEERGRGAGALGLEVNLPLSVQWNDALVTHSNLGGSLTPDAEIGPRERDASSVHLGQSLIWLARPNLNLLLEATWESRREAGVRSESSFVSPGLRFAIDRPSGLQIVPGIAFPIGIGDSDGERSVFLYLSLEHPFGR